MSTGTLRVILLWHMHQPYYKNLVTGEYRLPWVRLHASKDYYGMVKLLDEFPQVHQNFNLVPSLIAQIQEYASGVFREPFYEVAAKPAAELSPEEKRFALTYLFQANVSQMIGRYPRFRELYEKFKSAGEDASRAESSFTTRDYADLQVLSQLAWLDEYWLAQPDVKELIKKGEGYTAQDQRFVLQKQREIIKAVLPAYREAAAKGSIEISPTPYYHPILPLVCDTNQGAVSSPGLALPQTRFEHPEDAYDQIRRALDSHEELFGSRPKGMWPSEGSVSEEVLAIAAKNGLNWMATDEGVLGRSLDYNFNRDGDGRLTSDGAERLYKIYRYEKASVKLHLVFRDHRISDLIGFVYANMQPRDAAAHLLTSVKQAAEPLLKKGSDAVVPIILDGENAWEGYHENGRDFLRFFYEGLSKEPGVQACTISEAIALSNPKQFGSLKSLVPGSWINANFNVWIGAKEDNRAWDYLAEAREYFEEHAAAATVEQRNLAFEELLIAEGSDWNWWYGPEHHSANDRDFDELYRSHLSNVYQALGGEPPEYLAQPIAAAGIRPTTTAQTAYISPRINGRVASYFDWMGAAMYAADRRTSSMHGKQFVLDAVYAGINEASLSARADLTQPFESGGLEFRVHVDVERANEKHRFRLDVIVADGKMQKWSLLEENGVERQRAQSDGLTAGTLVAFQKILEFQIPFSFLGVRANDQVKVRFSVWRDRLPIDALPLEGSIELAIIPEEALAENSYATR
jgi:alpha-amylase/alpha-mannosidase (GH57 family)